MYPCVGESESAGQREHANIYMCMYMHQDPPVHTQTPFPSSLPPSTSRCITIERSCGEHTRVCHSFSESAPCMPRGSHRSARFARRVQACEKGKRRKGGKPKRDRITWPRGVDVHAGARAEARRMMAKKKGNNTRQTKHSSSGITRGDELVRREERKGLILPYKGPCQTRAHTVTKAHAQREKERGRECQGYNTGRRAMEGRRRGEGKRGSVLVCGPLFSVFLPF